MGEWIECGLPWNDFYYENVGNLVGLLIDTKDGIFLIGDINPSRGMCGCCTQFEFRTIVHRYKRVWEKEREIDANPRLIRGRWNRALSMVACCH